MVPSNSNDSKLKIYAISMIRNEGDIILPVLNHAANLFDRYIIVDVQSTDGTLETIGSFSQVWPNIELYTCSMQERYQSAMMNALAAKAFNDGADWIFFLDGDDASLGGSLQEAALLLAAVLDDGVLAGVEDGAVGCGGGEVLHLADEAGIVPDQPLVLGVDLQGDDLPCHGVPRR